MKEVIGVLILGAVSAAMIIFVVKLGIHLIRCAKSLAEVPSVVNTDELSLKKVKRFLSLSCGLLGYTALKWTYVMSDYLMNGVHAEANIYLLFLVIPVGVVIWFVGIVEIIRAIIMICRKSFPRQRLKLISKVILAVDVIMACLCAIELVIIMNLAG